jgi:hypothetical protein
MSRSQWRSALIVALRLVIETSTRQTHECPAPVASTPHDCGAERRIVAPIARTRFQGTLP